MNDQQLLEQLVALSLTAHNAQLRENKDVALRLLESGLGAIVAELEDAQSEGGKATQPAASAEPVRVVAWRARDGHGLPQTGWIDGDPGPDMQSAWIGGDIERAYAAPVAAQAQPKRRPYNASASLSEYGIFPECDAAPDAQQQQPGIGPMPPMNSEDTMTNSEIEQQIQAKGKTAPRITPADIEANIVHEHYFTPLDRLGLGDAVALSLPENAHLKPLGTLTFCVLVLRNGFTVTGESACASPENFDAEIGRKIARQNAVQKVWPLMGYQLRTEISRPLLAEADAAALAATKGESNG